MHTYGGGCVTGVKPEYHQLSSGDIIKENTGLVERVDSKS